MRATKPTLLVAAVAAVIAAAPAGCNAILGGGYAVGVTSNDGAPTAQTDGCATVPTSKPQFESACTNSTCASFPNATRNTKCGDGGTTCPAATAVTASVDSGPPDTGPADTDAGEDGGEDAAPVDAGPPQDAPP
jgi:hypothetical protein